MTFNGYLLFKNSYDASIDTLEYDVLRFFLFWTELPNLLQIQEIAQFLFHFTLMTINLIIAINLRLRHSCSQLAGALFVATMPQALSAWRVAAHFLVSFIIGVLGAEVLASWLVKRTGFDGAPVDALCAVLVSVVSVKILSFIHQQDIASLVSGLFSRLRGGGGGNVK